MRKLVVALGILIAAGLPGQPKLAVLDAVIPQSMDDSVIVPITDKIAEELVNSRKYSVLDRANVEQVLREREFQVSGMVADADIKEAGKYLGAEFVVVARVSLVDGTYFISARMINVETGAVVSQVSDQAEGRASVLIQIAANVGRKLATGTIEEVVVPEEETETVETVTPPPDRGGAETEEPKARPKLFIGAEVGLPMFLGDMADESEAWTDYWTNAAGYFDSSLGSFGFSATLSYLLVGPLYLGASLDLASQSLSYGDTTETTFSFTAFGAAAGVAFWLGPAQIYAGAKVGLGIVSLGEFWSSSNWTNDWEGLGSTGLTYGIEAGARFVLFNIFTLGARMEFLLGSVAGDSDLGLSGYFSAFSESYGLNTLRLHVGAGVALGG